MFVFHKTYFNSVFVLTVIYCKAYNIISYIFKTIYFETIQYNQIMEKYNKFLTNTM